MLGNYRRVAVVGLSPTTHDDAPFDDPTWEKWGLPWDERSWPFLDRCFEIHPLELLREKEAMRPSYYEDRLRNLDVPLYMQEAYPDIPNAIEYPVDKVIQSLRMDYFNSSIAYILALAIAEEVDKVGIWGVDMADLEGEPGDPSYISEFSYQRPNMEYLIGFAKGKGIDLYIPPESPLTRFHGEGIPLGTMYPSYPKRYGYLRE